MKILYPQITKEQYLESVDYYTNKANELDDEKYLNEAKKRRKMRLIFRVLLVLSVIGIYRSCAIENDIIGSVIFLICAIIIGCSVIALICYGEDEAKERAIEERQCEYEETCPGVADLETRENISDFLEQIAVFQRMNICDVEAVIGLKTISIVSASSEIPLKAQATLHAPWALECVRSSENGWTLDFTILDKKIEQNKSQEK